MLGRYTDTEQVGVYNVSISLARLLIFPLTALGFVFMPLAGKMFSRRQMPELKRTYQVLTKWIFSATLPIFFILFFFSEMTITFLFGERFIVSSTSLKFLLIGFLFYSFTGVSGMLMMVIGKSVELMNIYMFGTFVNILLNYIMIKLSGLGIAGAAFATLISYILIYSMISLKLYNESRMHPFTPEYIKPIAGSAIIGVMIYGIAKSLPLYLWMMPLYFIIFFAGYCVSLLVTRSLDKEDIMLFSAILERMGMRFSWLQRLTESSLNEYRKD
jgi:O-antigen/teichoic acid export membrane protein